MYKQVKRISLTFALFVFAMLSSFMAWAPPAPSYPAPSDDFQPPNVSIDEPLFSLLFMGLLIGLLAIKKYQSQLN